MSEQSVTIFTIGHSNLQVEELFRLLQAHGVCVLMDVRSSPYSKFATQFNKDALQAHSALAASRIRYMYAGKLLGGRPDSEVYYDDEGFVLYDEMAKSYSFQEGIDKLMAVARQAQVALMCSEEDPHQCHRRLLIARVLAEDEGVTVLHLRGDGRVQSEEDLQMEETAGQLDLGFDDLTENASWKSSQSVSRKKAPPNSSEFFDRPASDDW